MQSLSIDKPVMEENQLAATILVLCTTMVLARGKTELWQSNITSKLVTKAMAGGVRVWAKCTQVVVG